MRIEPPPADDAIRHRSWAVSTANTVAVSKDLALTAVTCVAVVLLAVGINEVEVSARHRFLFWRAVAVLPACVALPLLGRFNVLAASVICLSTIWFGVKHLGDGDAGAGLMPGLMIGIGSFAVPSTLLAWGYSRGMPL